MVRRLGFLCAALAMFFIGGGHWTVLQTVAWAEMLHDCSQRGGSLTVAVEQTFDGQHPCDLCRAIQTAKSKERQGNPAAPTSKQDAKVKALLADTTLAPVASATSERLFPATAFLAAPRRAEQPPTPPPRPGTRAA